MPAAPLIAMKSTKCESLEAVGKELDRRAHVYHNDIDPNRTYLNRNYRCRESDTAPLPLEQAIARRMGELNTKRKVRENQVRAMGFIVSTNDQLDDATAHRFLSETLNWFCQRYGYDNLLAAAEHYDEGTPHIQFWMAPVIHDETGYDRLSAKELFAPDKRKKNAKGAWEVVAQGTMSQLQEDFWRDVASKYGFEQPLNREKRSKGYRSLEAFKTHTGTTRELKTVIGGLEAERNAKAAEVQEMEGKAWVAGQLAAAKQLQADQAAARLVETHGELGTVTQELTEKRQLSGLLDSENAEKKAENEELEAKNAQILKQIPALESDIKDKKAQLSELDSEIEAKNERLERVRRVGDAFESGEIGAREEQARAAISELKPQVRAAEERISKADGAIERLRKTVGKLRARVEQLGARIEDARAVIAKIKPHARKGEQPGQVVTRHCRDSRNGSTRPGASRRS